jgi:hypothetical protein
MKPLLSTLAVLAPVLAVACPVCGAGDRPNAALFIGAMIVAPYVVAAVVIRAIRSAGGEEP